MNPRKVLITGAFGFVGKYLTTLLVKRGYEVYGLDRELPSSVPDGCRPLIMNLEDPAALEELPREWYGVIHLAGASIPSQFASMVPVVFNLHLTLNLLEHLQSARVILVSSCHVYAPSELVRGEDHAIQPQGRYGLSKHLLEQLVPHYQGKLDLRVARPFNHLGPGQRPELVIPSLIHRLASHPKNDPSPIQMQGQNSIRDFIDVNDVVSAYLAILELESPIHHTFNVCTGRPCSVGEVVQTVLNLTGSTRTIQFANKPNSTDDIPFLVGNPSRLVEAASWKPLHSLADSLQSMLNTSLTYGAPS